jgi:hypothetical protein
MSALVVALIAFYVVFVTEMVRAMHEAPQWNEPEF